jgi:hypothetical protein
MSEFGSRAGNALEKIPSQKAAKGCYPQVTFRQQFEEVRSAVLAHFEMRFRAVRPS